MHKNEPSPLSTKPGNVHQKIALNSFGAQVLAGKFKLISYTSSEVGRRFTSVHVYKVIDLASFFHHQVYETKNGIILLEAKEGAYKTFAESKTKYPF